MELSVILITWNAEHHVVSCLQSVLSAVKGLDHEILLVENGSTDRTRDLLKSYITDSHFRYFPNDENLGVARARNIALKVASGKFIWILDIDTVVNREALQSMLLFMNKHQNCGICACRLLHSNGEEQDSCRHFPSIRYKIVNILSGLSKKHACLIPFKKRLEKISDIQFYRNERKGNKALEVEYVIGACQLIRHEVVDQIGWLDEHIFYGPEDADYCLRAIHSGWKVFYLPYVSFIHDYQRITNRRLFSKIGGKHLKSLFYFWWKYKRC